MKTRLRKTIMTLVSIGLMSSTAWPAILETISHSSTFTTSLPIPDGDWNGIADTLTITTPIYSVSELRVSLDISCDYTGDIYAYLRHDTGFTVLLNQAGRTTANPYGYADGGFDVTFTRGAVDDIHCYQLTLDPDGGVVTGEWQPDGRNVHPGEFSESVLRSADFSSFNGINPNGDWTLYVVDVSPVGLASLNHWKLDITGAVPEPVAWPWVSLGLGTAFFFWRRRA